MDIHLQVFTDLFNMNFTQIEEVEEPSAQIEIDNEDALSYVSEEPPLLLETVSSTLQYALDWAEIHHAEEKDLLNCATAIMKIKCLASIFKLIPIWKITVYLAEYWDDPYALGTVGKPQSVAFRRYPDRRGTFSRC
ncbi:hypothetical protein P691DRAFT_766711 [Macrolepiota fuliginosa MF-IS2]|uniref:Uncharacterized protein n=1 Tax=Macrolepiota fuliginosa MF-IS2 TaxID=1400762 RepID=A0A9P5X0K2_9AGAR|nr:hypothetical protein P691DRAFT_766711 [Macrolepiota fuliginosa MF-IS2]